MGELHQKEPTPVADVARPGSCSEPRKLRLPLIFLQTPNHWRKCQEWCRRVFFTYYFFFAFHSVHVSSGRKRGKVGCKYEASRSATGNRSPTSNIFTCDPWRSERPSQRHKPSPEHDLLGMSSAKRKLIMCIQKMIPTPGEQLRPT